MGTAYDSRKVREVFPKLMAYHRWFCNARDPQGKGVIGIIHPWESGRDNCPDWDIGMKGITVPDNLMSYARRDTSYVDSDQRPSQAQYDRFVTIVQFGREVKWDHRAINARGPFLMADPGVQFILLRACRDLQELARLLDMDEPIEEIRVGSTVSQRGVTGFGTTTLVAIARATSEAVISATPLPTPRCSASLLVWVRRTSAPVWWRIAAGFWMAVGMGCRVGIRKIVILNRKATGEGQSGRS